MSGLEINAQGLENLFAGKLATRPPDATVAEAALTFLAGLFLIIALPPARGAMRALAAVAPLLALGALGAALWSHDRVLTDVATPGLGCGVVVVSLLGGGLAEVDAQRRRLRRELEIGRLAAARAEGELEAGRLIQMGILPKPETLAPDPRFDLDALMEPARTIGGDLYDFFKIDPDRLFIAVGDVSGKGLPASLFMALGKSLCKSCALRGETRHRRHRAARQRRDLARQPGDAVHHPVRGDPRSANRCHELLQRRQRRALPDPSRPAAGVGDRRRRTAALRAGGLPLRDRDVRLQPGDLICATTDGVTEAMTEAGALIGRGAVERVLAATPADASAHEVTVGLRAAVAEFVAGADPSDDLTILTLRWRGAT